MKKILSLIVILMMCLAIASCGGQSAGVAETEETAESAEDSETPETGAEASADDSEASDSDVEAAQKKAQEQDVLTEVLGSMDFAKSLGSFTAEDLDGNKVTEAYFNNADVTIVHVWATYCGPCLGEMENLGKMAESLPDNAQVLGIVADVPSSDSSEGELARQILADNNVKFTNIVPNSDFAELFKYIVGVPTTFIVDSSGNVVASPIVGSNVAGYTSMAEEYLKSIAK